MSKAIQIFVEGDLLYVLTDAGRVYRNDFCDHAGWKDVTGPWAEPVVQAVANDPSCKDLKLDRRSRWCLENPSVFENGSWVMKDGIRDDDPARKILTMDMMRRVPNFGRTSVGRVMQILLDAGISEGEILSSAFCRAFPPSWRMFLWKGAYYATRTGT